MTLSIFPDVNVWLALTYARHEHFQISDDWFQSLDEGSVFYFSRQTQLGIFRLLSNAAVMQEHVYTQRACWRFYEDWLSSGRARMMTEPYELDRYFKPRSSRQECTTKEWADAFLSAFAESAGLRLVTFDRALGKKLKGSIVLG